MGLTIIRGTYWRPALGWRGNGKFAGTVNQSLTQFARKMLVEAKTEGPNLRAKVLGTTGAAVMSAGVVSGGSSGRPYTGLDDLFWAASALFLTSPEVWRDSLKGDDFNGPLMARPKYFGPAFGTVFFALGAVEFLGHFDVLRNAPLSSWLKTAGMLMMTAYTIPSYVSLHLDFLSESDRPLHFLRQRAAERKNGL